MSDELDPRIAGVIGGIILIIISFIIQDERAQAEEYVNKIKEIPYQIDACNGNVECEKNLERVLRTYQSGLNTIELANSIKTLFFWFGLLVLVSRYSLYGKEITSK